MRLLLASDRPGGSVAGSSVAPGGVLDDATLAALYGAPQGQRWVRANFVATVDGAAVGPDGRSASINTAADHVVFELLRAQSDVVLVGAGTVRDEHYTRLSPDPRWRGVHGGRPPMLAVVSRTAALPDRVVGPSEDGGEVMLVTCSDAPTGAVARARELVGADSVLVHGEGSVDLTAALDDLAERGLTHVLSEGGPSLLGHIVRTAGLDELCLTISPLVVGGDQLRVVTGPDLRLAAKPVLLVEEDGTLMGRWLLGPVSAAR